MGPHRSHVLLLHAPTTCVEDEISQSPQAWSRLERLHFNPFPDARRRRIWLEPVHSATRRATCSNGCSSQQFADAAWRASCRTYAAANRANVSFYTIDPRGLWVGRTSRERRPGGVGHLRPQEQDILRVSPTKPAATRSQPTTSPRRSAIDAKDQRRLLVAILANPTDQKTAGSRSRRSVQRHVWPQLYSLKPPPRVKGRVVTQLCAAVRSSLRRLGGALLAGWRPRQRSASDDLAEELGVNRARRVVEILLAMMHDTSSRTSRCIDVSWVGEGREPPGPSPASRRCATDERVLATVSISTRRRSYLLPAGSASHRLDVALSMMNVIRLRSCDGAA